ncbi:MAG: glycosyltransferase family 2 protein [Candidatus Sungiibacteriota bacterium]|uniref:Glycosyltransferase family 2 protein n=1 Tax=Candidatus Sungiibacteriota bacterium TaxID=2750080 RepID=A0A7T5US26_9BACT|nr:MAG: glycosyltransferase family 2 protein [Candidatus Sungbacteria bacterium]
MPPEISIVAPMHNEEGNARPLYNAIKQTMDNLGRSYEIIFVNDFSRDNTLNIFKEIKSRDPNFHYCDLEENAGENWAMLAGVSRAQGKMVVTIDGDFQNDPRYIPLLLDKLSQGYRVVSGWRRNRIGGFFSRIAPSVAANFLISLISGVRVHDCGCGLKVYRREVLAGKFVPKGFMNRFSPVVFGVKNQEFAEVEIEDRVRIYGRSHYGAKRILIVFNDLFALLFILRGFRKMRPVVLTLALIFPVLGLLAATLLPPRSLQFIVLVGAVLLMETVLVSIYWNLGRFLEAEVRPRFKIKEFV